MAITSRRSKPAISKNGAVKKYRLTFVDEAEKAAFIKANSNHKITDEAGLQLQAEVEKTHLNEFFETMSHYAIARFEEVTFSLEQYFMSFYKENKSFGGLKGIEGERPTWKMNLW